MTKAGIVKNEQAHSLHIDNAKIPAIKKEWQDVDSAWKVGEHKYQKAYEPKFDAVMGSKEMADFKAALTKFEHSPLGQKAENEIKQLKDAISHHLIWSDMPQNK